jgi:5-methylcytosine-specific restriction endonuclease McrA
VFKGNPLPLEEVGGVVLVIAAAFRSIRFRLRISRGKRNKDPQRLFNQSQKRELYTRCGYRCEYPRPFLGRCHAKATEADHVYPWSLGGPTTLENAAGLCKRHNLKKSNHIPTRRYMRALNRNRRYDLNKQRSMT